MKESKAAEPEQLVTTEVEAISDYIVEYVRRFQKDELNEIQTSFGCVFSFDKDRPYVVVLRAPSGVVEYAWTVVNRLLTDAHWKLGRLTVTLTRDLEELIRVRMARLQEMGDEMKFLVKLEKQRMLIVGPTQYASEFLKNAEKILGLKMAVVPPGGKPRPIEGAAGPISSPRKQWGCVYRATSGKLSVYVWKCDITIMHVDVIVNAANERLDHGGGWSSFILF